MPIDSVRSTIQPLSASCSRRPVSLEIPGLFVYPFLAPLWSLPAYCSARKPLGSSSGDDRRGVVGVPMLHCRPRVCSTALWSSSDKLKMSAESELGRGTLIHIPRSCEFLPKMTAALPASLCMSRRAAPIGGETITGMCWLSGRIPRHQRQSRVLELAQGVSAKCVGVCVIPGKASWVVIRDREIVWTNARVERYLADDFAEGEAASESGGEAVAGDRNEDENGTAVKKELGVSVVGWRPLEGADGRRAGRRTLGQLRIRPSRPSPRHSSFLPSRNHPPSPSLHLKVLNTSGNPSSQQAGRLSERRLASLTTSFQVNGFLTPPPTMFNCALSRCFAVTGSGSPSENHRVHIQAAAEAFFLPPSTPMPTRLLYELCNFESAFSQ